jgi:hypothetical protein
MGSVSLTGKDVISIGSTLTSGASLRVLNDLADGDTATLDLPNDVSAVKIGKNGNSLYAYNSTGKSCDVQLRVILGSADDKFLNAEYNRYVNDPASYTLLSGEFLKKVGDGLGNANSIIYKLGGGIIKRLPTVKENVEGDTEQAVAIWPISFANTDRAIS